MRTDKAVHVIATQSVFYFDFRKIGVEIIDPKGDCKN